MITTRFSQVCLAFILVLILVSACAPGIDPGVVPGPTGEGVTLPVEPTVDLVERHACDHPFFPAVAGANWTYTGVDSIAGPYSFTDTIINLRKDGFTLSGDFGDLVREQEWSCLEPGLAALDYAGLGAGRVSASGMNFQLETTGMMGITLPVDLAPGSTWTQSFAISGTMVLEGSPSGIVTGTANSTNEALGFETVEVPAGTFEALHLARMIELDLLVTLGDASFPVTINSIEAAWFAEGVGWIKSSFTGTIQDLPVDESIVLAEFSMP